MVSEIDQDQRAGVSQRDVQADNASNLPDRLVEPKPVETPSGQQQKHEGMSHRQSNGNSTMS